MKMQSLAQSTNRSVALERLGVVSYTNVAPLHYSLTASDRLQFIYGVPTELNQQLLAGGRR